MGERNPFMDYRNAVPFVNLTGFVVKQPNALDETPISSLKEFLTKKRFSSMVNLRRMQYRIMCEAYKNGRV